MLSSVPHKSLSLLFLPIPLHQATYHAKSRQAPHLKTQHQVNLAILSILCSWGSAMLRLGQPRDPPPLTPFLTHRSSAGPHPQASRGQPPASFQKAGGTFGAPRGEQQAHWRWSSTGFPSRPPRPLPSQTLQPAPGERTAGEAVPGRTAARPNEGPVFLGEAGRHTEEVAFLPPCLPPETQPEYT